MSTGESASTQIALMMSWLKASKLFSMEVAM